jgi:hypothetical protein
MEEKIIEMPIKTADDVRAYIKKMVEGALEFKGLTPDDRNAIDVGRRLLDRGFFQISSDDPAVRQDAARLLMLGAFELGTRTGVSDSEAKYWEIKKRGGKKLPGKREKAMRAWQSYIRVHLPDVMQSNPAFNQKELAEEFTLDESAPSSMPKDVDYLVKFVRKEIKALKNESAREPLRLVHGGKGMKYFET